MVAEEGGDISSTVVVEKAARGRRRRASRVVIRIAVDNMRSSIGMVVWTKKIYWLRIKCWDLC